MTNPRRAVPRHGEGVTVEQPTRSGIDLSAPDELAIHNVTAGDTHQPDDLLAAAIFAKFHAARPAWHSDPQRGCAGMNPAVFVSRVESDRRAAFNACGVCRADIRGACLEFGLETGDTRAILGGHDPASRRRLAKQRRANGQTT